MNLTCYIIDDESHAIELLRAFIEKTPGLELAGASTKPLAALAEIQAAPPDLAFVDVDMPDLSGLDLAGMINRYTTVVFTTSYREFAPEAFEKEAADYLLKPIGYDRFLQGIEKIRRVNFALPATGSPDFFFVKTGIKGVLAKINIAGIIYVSGLSAYVEIHLADRKVITYLSLAELLEKLPPGRFSRIHKSFIVSHDHIQAIEGGQVLLPGAERLAIGRAYRAAFFKKLGPALLVSKRDQS